MFWSFTARLNHVHVSWTTLKNMASEKLQSQIIAMAGSYQTVGIIVMFVTFVFKYQPKKSCSTQNRLNQQKQNTGKLGRVVCKFQFFHILLAHSSGIFFGGLAVPMKHPHSILLCVQWICMYIFASIVAHKSVWLFLLYSNICIIYIYIYIYIYTF